MNIIKKQLPYLILAMVIVGSLFYWYEWRPAKIRKECYRVYENTFFPSLSERVGKAIDGDDSFNINDIDRRRKKADIEYQNCLRAMGLKGK